MKSKEEIIEEFKIKFADVPAEGQPIVSFSGSWEEVVVFLDDSYSQQKQEMTDKYNELKKKYQRMNKFSAKYAEAISLMADGVNYEDLPKHLQ